MRLNRTCASRQPKVIALLVCVCLYVCVCVSMYVCVHVCKMMKELINFFSKTMQRHVLVNRQGPDFDPGEEGLSRALPLCP